MHMLAQIKNALIWHSRLIIIIVGGFSINKIILIKIVCCIVTCRRANMDDFLEFDEKEREHDVLQKRLVLEKKVLLLPLVPHISHTAAEEKLNILLIVLEHEVLQCHPVKLQSNQNFKKEKQRC